MAEQQTRKGGSCFVTGCLIVLAVVILLIVGLYFGGRHFIRSAVDKYTSPDPTELSEVELSAQEMEALEARYNTFKENLLGQEAAEPLALTEEEINGLIINHPDFKEMADHVRVKIEESDLFANVSLPLDPLDIEAAEGRYLNGTLGLNPVIENDAIVLRVDSIEAKGEELPSYAVEQVNQTQSLGTFQFEVDGTNVVSELESIEVSEGKLTVTPK